MTYGPVRVQGRVYKDEWASCSCDVDTAADEDRYVCIECDGTGKVDLDVEYRSAAWMRAYRENKWTKRCGHCNGAGWHP